MSLLDPLQQPNAISWNMGDGNVSNCVLVNCYTEGQRVYLGQRSLSIGGNVTPTMLAPGSKGTIVGTAGTNLQFLGVDPADPTVGKITLTVAPLGTTRTVYMWTDAAAPLTQHHFRQFTGDSHASGFYWTRIQSGLAEHKSAGFTDPGFYRAVPSGTFVLPRPWLVASQSSTAHKLRQIVAGLVNMNGKACERGDLFEFESPSAAGWLGMTCVAAGTYAVPWTVSTAVALGSVMQPSPPNGHFYTATAVPAPWGVTHPTTQPNWPLTTGGTVVDGATGNVTWTESGAVAVFKNYGAIEP
jgi:hypothetical protein